jgi:hypothetical protein
MGMGAGTDTLARGGMCAAWQWVVSDETGAIDTAVRAWVVIAMGEPGACVEWWRAERSDRTGRDGTCGVLCAGCDTVADGGS